MKRITKFGIAILVLCIPQFGQSAEVELGPRPYFLVDQMKNGPLKDKLLSCSAIDFRKSDFSIGHRGAPLQFPEHTIESNRAAARMGAGILECDVTFTSDKELVCRHSQNDLHTTTNILKSDLAPKCTRGFSPASSDRDADAECRTSDITLSEFRTLAGKMDAVNNQAVDVDSYLDATAGWRTDLYATQSGTLMTHAESIELFRKLGTKFTPELKTPSVEMPYKGFTQADFAQKLVDEYKAAGIPASDVWPQSFNLQDVIYWIENEPEFGRQAVYLDSSFRRAEFDPDKPETFSPSMSELKEMGINFLAPPIWMLLTLEDGEIVPSAYAREARNAGLDLLAWTLERSGTLKNGGGWYYQTVAEVINNDGMVYEVLDVLTVDVGIKGIFSDWPATVTYYANCMGIGIE
ncbi:MAG: glycerophosphodiester phosphodiesterase family protein [Pseudomonadota bacterium]